jgi:hypothetical protein
LQEDADAAFINSFHEYLTVFDATGRVAPTPGSSGLRPRGRRKGFNYIVGFFALAGIALLIIFFDPTRPVWLPLAPLGIGVLLLIAGVINEWRHPV